MDIFQVEAPEPIKPWKQKKAERDAEKIAKVGDWVAIAVYKGDQSGRSAARARAHAIRTGMVRGFADYAKQNNGKFDAVIRLTDRGWKLYVRFVKGVKEVKG